MGTPAPLKGSVPGSEAITEDEVGARAFWQNKEYSVEKHRKKEGQDDFLQSSLC